jgi:poly(A) polymerase/tRNA nucleotidyltransferase (CCA-adding enzyme)
VDLFSGVSDLEKGLIRAVGDPQKRFQEDALRLLRAVRFAVELGFKIERKTADSIRKNSALLKKISRERMRDELTKIIESAWPAEGIVLLHRLNLLKHVLPTLEEGVGVEQNWHHIYSVFNHSVLSLKFCFSDELVVRLAALLHDAAKPRVKRIGKGVQATFHFHEVEGEKLAREVLNDLRFPSNVVTEVALLVKHHMFNYDPALHNEKTVRRLLHRVGGNERMAKLLVLRIGDRLGSGCKKGEVYKLRQLKYLIEKVSADPISLKQLKVNGQDLMNDLKLKPGPTLGSLLDILLAQVVENPALNKRKKLLEIADKIWLTEKQNPGYLEKEGSTAKNYLEGKVEERNEKLQRKYWVEG